MLRRNWKYYSIIAGLLLLLWFVVNRFEGCDRAIVTPTDIIKKVVAEKKLDKDSVHTITVYIDRIKDRVVTKYKEVRHDSLIPCEEKLILCDTVIYVDSILIAELKQEIKIDNEIIAHQDKIITNDSLQIVNLTKSVKRQKRRTKIAAAIAVIFAGIAIAK